MSKVLSDEASRQAVERLLESARASAAEVVASKKHVVAALSNALLQRDELVGDEITAVLAAAETGN